MDNLIYLLETAGNNDNNLNENNTAFLYHFINKYLRLKRIIERIEPRIINRQNPQINPRIHRLGTY